MPASQGALVASTLAAILSRILELGSGSSPPGPSQDVNLTLGSLDCLSKTNLDQVCEWNAEYEIHPVERCVHDVIGDRVREAPDKDAICAWDGQLTYRELDHVASRLAERLVRLGVGPEVLVPLCFEKSVRISLSCCLAVDGAAWLIMVLEMDSHRDDCGVEGWRRVCPPGPVTPC